MVDQLMTFFFLKTFQAAEIQLEKKAHNNAQGDYWENISEYIRFENNLTAQLQGATHEKA